MPRVEVTIGIPFLNAQRYLSDAVRSVFAQTFTNWELILVDDGSTDGSAETIHRIDDSRVRLIRDGVNRGLCARLNQIAALAQGKYLARMDADDLMHPQRLARQFEFLETNPSIDLADTSTYTIDDDNVLLGIRGDRPLDCAPAAVLKSGLLIHPTVMGRMHWFREHPYDGAFFRAEDHELWVRTCQTSTFGRLQTPLFFYRESLTGNLKNYLASAKTIRRIISQYGPATVGRLESARLRARSHLKGWLYRAFTRLGCQSRLIRKRTRPLDAHEAQSGQSALRAILDTKVPGLDAALLASAR